MGKIFIQVERIFVNKIEIVYSGQIDEKVIIWFICVFLKGYFEFLVQDIVNYVNFQFLVKEQGIEVIESKKEESGKFKNMIIVRFIISEKVLEFFGIVYNNEGRIIDFFGYKVDFKLEKYMFFIQNIDKLGMIGRIGIIVGEYGINIVIMQVLCNKKGEKVVMVCEIDGVLFDEVVEKFKNIDGILRVMMVKL